MLEFQLRWRCLPVLAVLVCAVAQAGSRSSASYRIVDDSIDSGGRHVWSAAYTVDGSVGQVSDEPAVGGSITLNAGYAAQLPETPSLVTATINTATDVPFTANGFSATGLNLHFILNFIPASGAVLKIVNNTGSSLINGSFGDVAQGGVIAASYGGSTYHFIANYLGGDGNDLTFTLTEPEAPIAVPAAPAWAFVAICAILIAIAFTGLKKRSHGTT